MTSPPVRRPERRLRAVPAPTPAGRQPWTWLYRGGVLILLSLIAYNIAQPDGLERCVEQRYRQVLSGHRLNDGQIRQDVRVSERNKATNYCNGGTGQLHWQP